MKKITLLSLMLFTFIGLGIAQTNPGDIAFTAFNADGADDFAFVTLVDIPMNSEIWFTDNEWTGAAFNNVNEGEIKWTATSAVSAGTVIVINSTGGNSPTVNTGTAIGGGINLGASNETLYAILEEPAVVMPLASFLAGISNDDNGSGGTLVGTGLTAGTDFMNFANDNDGFAYTGARTGEAAFADYLPLIMNVTNWQIEASDGTAILPISTVAFSIGGAPVAVAPTFTPPAGVYTVAQNVVLSSTTPAATIYYTTDGVTNPDNTSTVYVAAIPVASSTTIKAIAYAAGMTESSISTAAYNFPVDIADIATLRAQATDGTVYKLTGEALITYQRTSRNQKYIQDATAGILIDDSPGKITTPYAQYDGVSGITGTLNDYNGMLQFQPTADPGVATTTGNVFTPEVITATDLANNFEDYEAEVVQFEYMRFDATGNFSGYSNYDMGDLGGVTAILRTNFSESNVIGSAIPTSRTHVTCIPTQSNTYYNVTPRDLTDLEVIPPGIPLSNAGILIAGLLIAGILVVRRGRLF